MAATSRTSCRARRSIWFYFREHDYAATMELFETAKRIAQGAAMMTDTKLADVRILGSAWSGHFNKPIAEATYENIKRVGLPTVGRDGPGARARRCRREIERADDGTDESRSARRAAVQTLENWMGGGSDDIGDVSWNVPTVTLRYPANIPGLPGHNWANAIAMATPIAHKGDVSGREGAGDDAARPAARSRRSIADALELLPRRADEGR